MGAITVYINNVKKLNNSIILPNTNEKLAFMTSTLRKFLPVFMCFAILHTATYAQDGTLDATFGTGGKVTADIGGVADKPTAMVIQPDGKILMAGFTVQGITNLFAIARFMPDGTLDNSFGTNGKVMTDTASNDGPVSMKLQSDNKIIVASSKNQGFILIRLNTNGKIDSTFGTNGRYYSGIIAPYTICNALAIQSNNYIVAAGNTGCDIAVARFKPNGDRDSTFGINGVKVYDAGGCDRANALLIQPDNKIVIAGGVQEGADGHFLVARFNANGAEDVTFGTVGKTTIDIRNYNEAYSCARQTDGKIVLAGQAKFVTQSSFGVARVDENGKVDSSFATNGKTYVAFNGTNEPKAIALQADNKIVFAGYNNDVGDLEVAVLRFKTDGTVDSTFGFNGRVRVANGTLNFGKTVAIQADGKIVIGSETVVLSPPNSSDFGLTRLVSFNPLPLQLTSFTGQAIKSGVQLNWSTAIETNSSHFIVERSNTSSFNAIGRVNSGSNNSQLQQYSYVDITPINGENFYRLKQVDKDGRFAYSKIIRVVFGNMPYLVAYPNPTKYAVNIGGISAGAYLTVVDAGGRLIKQYKATGNNYAIPIQQLNAGIYFIRVAQNGKTTTLKVVKE